MLRSTTGGANIALLNARLLAALEPMPCISMRSSDVGRHGHARSDPILIGEAFLDDVDCEVLASRGHAQPKREALART